MEKNAWNFTRYSDICKTKSHTSLNESTISIVCLIYVVHLKDKLNFLTAYSLTCCTFTYTLRVL